MKPMLFESARIEDLPALAADEAVALEQKCDGVRVMAEIRPGGVTFTGNSGGPVTFAAAAQWLGPLAEWLDFVSAGPDFMIVLDGELMIDDGSYIVFDLPYLSVGGDTGVRPGDPLSLRRAALERLSAAFRGPVRLIPQAVAAGEKVRLLAAVAGSGGEGFMVKRLDSPYEPGIRVRHSLKCKFQHTADVIVTSWERGAGTGSARLAAYNEDGELVPVGSCSLIGKPEVRDGDVVEVRFAHYRDAMIQPTMLRVRPDKRARDCTTDQFVPYSKAVI
jgi:bifunctional non-homologous end joining protein LigD